MANKKKILAVDDDPEVLRLLDVKLRENGYEVLFARDGLTAMAEVRAHHPDLIILDIGMPAGDGFVTLDRLKKNVAYSETPVIVLTARDPAEVRDRALEAGAVDFFEKTQSTNDLMAAVWRHVAAETY